MEATADSTADAARSANGFLTLREVVKLTGAHFNTIRRASDSGELKAYRLPSGHRRWNRSDIFSWLGIEDVEPAQQPASQILIYARVSSHKQSKNYEKGSIDNDLGRQIERLKKVAAEKYECTNPIVYLDTASGLSFTRKGLLRLLNDILAGKFNHSILICTHKDRLARFGTEVILQICKSKNVEVVFTERTLDESGEKELADDILAIVTHFSARVHGARASRTTSKILSAETITLAKALHDAGNSVPQIVAKLAEEGHRAENGGRITYHAVTKYIVRNKLLLQILPARPKTNLQDYVDQCLEAAEPHSRIGTRAIYEHYCRWCKSRNESPAKINKLSQLLGKLGFKRAYQIGDQRAKGYSALKIKGENKHQYLKQIRRGSQADKLLKQTN
jgi:excisionase family DNA binding protein